MAKKKKTARKKTVKRKAATQKPPKGKALKKKVAKKKAAKASEAKPRPPKLRDTLPPPPDELQWAYNDLLDHGDSILDEFDGGDEPASYYADDIEAWEDERDEFFERAEEVFVKLFPQIEPTGSNLDDWLGGSGLHGKLI